MLFLIIAVDVVRRFRASNGLRRQQFRWLARAALVAPTLFGIGLSMSALWDVEGVTDWTDSIILAAFILGLPALAAGIGVAVLKYRLWDVDRVVSRTVTYAVVTALLAATYATLVLALQAVTGPADASDAVVAASTLVAAALFRPVRDRVQRMVDRRFDRSRFDHGRILDAFAGRLRDEVDLDVVAADLRSTVGAALAPATNRVWIRQGGPG